MYGCMYVAVSLFTVRYVKSEVLLNVLIFFNITVGRVLAKVATCNHTYLYM